VNDAATFCLGSTDIRVPRLGVGTANWGDPSRFGRFDLGQMAYGPVGSLEQQRGAVDVSIALGAGFFDTAGMYGGGASERVLGELLRDKQAFIATKFPSRLRSSRAGDLPQELERSLSRLGRKSVGLYQVHSAFPWLSIPRVMDRMADAVSAGKIRAVGVSNFSAAQLRLAHGALAARGVPLAAIQVEYSLLQRSPETNGVLDACRELGVTLIAYMPLAMGALSGRYAGDVRPAGFRRHLSVFRASHRGKLSGPLAVLHEIAGRYQRSAAEVALRWLIQRDVLPIPGAKNAEQAEKNAGALTFSLGSSDVEALERVTRDWRA
jgi:aryl-alcohol dehydrogenase-like predicted oxidoreductase